MFLVLVMAGALWGLGMAMKTPVQARLTMIGLLFVGVIALHVILPDGHPLRAATGESAAPWLFIAGAVAVVMGYRVVLRRVKAQAEAKEAAQPTPAPKGPFSSVELNRYARHIVLREVGGAGQKALKDAKVLVVGAGGLGSPVLQYLAAAGVGTIGVVDDDAVDNANLQRQVIHADDDIGMPKVFSAQKAMVAQNPYVDVRPYHRRLDLPTALDLLADYDIVVDGTDNFDTRYLINEAAVQTQTPLVSGALTQWEGQLSVFDPATGGPCYRCVFPEAPDPSLAPPCSEAGVIGPLPGVVGTMMALEVIKMITQAGHVLRSEMLIYDGLYGETRKIKVMPRKDCPVCGA